MLYQLMKITFQTWYISPEMPEGLPILKEGSGKWREIVHIIECFLSTHKSVGLTKSTWDYWTAKGLRNEIWRSSPLGHLWHEVIIICQLFCSLCEMNVVLSCQCTELQLAKMACVVIFQRTLRPPRLPTVLRMTPLIHSCFSCAYFQLLLEVDLGCRIIYSVWYPPLRPVNNYLI